MVVQFNILDFILIFVPNIWGSYQVGLLSLGPVGPWEGRTQFLKCVYNSTFLILSWFLCQTFGGVIKFDCCLWALSGPEKGGGAQFLKCVYNSTFLILSWFLCQTVGGVIELDCCLWALRGGDCTNSKMSVHFNIFYSILILCQQFGGVFKLDCCLWALRGEGHNF